MKIEAALYKPFGEQSEWVLPRNAAPETKGWIGKLTRQTQGCNT